MPPITIGVMDLLIEGQMGMTVRLLDQTTHEVMYAETREQAREAWEDANFEPRGYDGWIAYGQSKTANVLFTVELERRLRGYGVHAYAVHPGMIRTDLGRHLTKADSAALKAMAKDAPGSGGFPSFKTIPEGAATSVWAATAPELAERGGTYIADCAISDEHAPWAMNPEAARRLWALSEQLVGETFAP
jgi:NAD(P)-dependent dehydrogenase (short-subunit alcohol dehydrogenase family)